MIGLILAMSLAFAAPPASPPEGQVLRPSLTTDQGVVQAGTAFALTVGKDQVLVTALQLLGPPGGLAKPISGGEVKAHVMSMGVDDAWSGVRVGQSTTALSLANTYPLSSDAAGDLVAFRVVEATGLDRANATPSKLAPLTLAETPAKVDQPVWVAGKALNGGEVRLHPAKVVQSDGKWLLYLFERKDLDLTGLAGAPVLDAAGKVVGMHVGGGPNEGDLVGAANPLPSLKQKLQDGLAAP